jgi:hypothetical protein
MALEPFGMEVLVKFTGTPTQTTKGFAVKFAVGVCALNDMAKARKNAVIKKRMRVKSV